jgi:hypothetical protein
MSLYANQSSAPKPNAGGFGMGQPAAPFGQLQGMDAFGFGQASPQPQQQQQQQAQQHNPWGNDDGFGAMQQASTTSSFDNFGTMNSNSNNSNYNNNNGFGAMGGASGFNSANGASNGMPQGGDFFNMIAGATKSPVASPPQSSNKNSG